MSRGEAGISLEGVGRQHGAERQTEATMRGVGQKWGAPHPQRSKSSEAPSVEEKSLLQSTGPASGLLFRADVRSQCWQGPGLCRGPKGSVTPGRGEELGGSR